MAATFTSAAFNLTTLVQTDDKISSAISGHYFNNALTVILPGTNSLPETVSECFADQLAYQLHGLPVYRLVEVPFIHAFVKNGLIYMLSANTQLDTHDCVAVTPDGWLILHLTKDTYHELGLEATKQTHQQKNSDTYVVKVNLLASYFKPGKKNYDSTLWCLKNRLDLVFDFHIAWEPKDDKVCSSSVSAYFLDKCAKVERRCLDRRTQVLTSLPCPKVQADDPEGTSGQSCHFQEVFEWIGAVACGVDMTVKDEDTSYTSSLCCPEPSQNCPRCCLFQVSGFITPGTILKVFKALRQYTTAHTDLPPASLTVHGFQDSPIFTNNCPHHLHICGDNLMTFVYLPSNQCWLYRAVAS
ncbi:ribonuclease p protein subunit p40 [Plakobranchus ocellatus]|uniref:Ribonuclease p protein subunit p40 n=1 Tax=Plakobranchus ocellatus TaxID=259542 RepID=A0AAV3XWY7_9GAST|nr:ribonuclease p protein subunit p40 [Plakobranchus ocellatus]